MRASEDGQRGNAVDLCFDKVVRKCSSFVIACEACDVTKRGAEADVDHQNGEGSTALQFACQFSNVEVAELLLERGANKDLRDNDGDGVGYYIEGGPREEELLALLARY